MEQQKNLELKVGIFVLLGLVAAGILIVSFGRFGELFQTSYPLTLQFKNTSGIIKNSQVLYRGARVGTVATSPRIAQQGKRVEVGLQINKDILIDRESTFEVGSYGLLGDRFIDVQPPDEPSGHYLEPEDVVEGDESVGFGDLTEKLDPIVQQLEKFVSGLEEEGVVENLAASMESIKAITAKLDKVLEQAEAGEGPIFTLLNDRQTAEELKDTISEFKQLGENLRKRGILFYKDLSEVEEEDGDKRHPRIQRARER